MTFHEWFAEYEMHLDAQGGPDCYAGGLTRGDLDEIDEVLNGFTGTISQS